MTTKTKGSESESEIDDGIERDERDETILSDWFAIFREGDYGDEVDGGQGSFSAKDIKEIVTEFQLTRRRSPIVFDHLNDEDMEPDSKPGPAAGYVVALRAVPDKTEQYKGKMLLEARAKVGGYATWMTRSGMFRNCSVGLYRHKSHVDSKVRLALHHLALLGAIPPGVEGLPEVIFSGSTSKNSVSKVSFSLGNEFRISKHSESGPIHTNQRESTVETINFSEHTAKMDSQKATLELEHSKVVTKFNEQISSLEEKVEETEAKLETTTAELEATKASIPAAVEAARQEGIAAGEKLATEKAERLFREKEEKAEVTNFCSSLRASGRITEQELKGTDDGKVKPMAEIILSIPAGDPRVAFRSLLEKRPGLTNTTLFREGTPPASQSVEDTEEAQTREAQKLVKQGKFTNFREAFAAVRNGTGE